jgi:tetratricopeptide (TPR) repeat protein
MADDSTKDDAPRQDDVGLPPGAKIGKYEVRERLGMGGQAIVYRCTDPTLDRDVAVKQISAHLAADPEFLNRFRREAQILARVGATQPAVITIHELLEDERGLFIVMEYVRGHTLEATIRDSGGPVEPRAALQILWRLAAALHDVHRAGIVHRDLKPGNIIITEGLRPKITDFGLAAAGSEQTSVLMGTTKYMAPELFEGKPADARADIYSLGFIAYEMLLGRKAFNEVFADVVRDKHSAAMRWMKWHGNEKVQAPSLRELNPSVPEPLSEIVAKMIAKNPDERFQSMEELGRAIKERFSPRARGAAAPAAPGREQAGGKAKRPHRRREPEPRSADVGPGDEGDELDLELDAPPTARIPRKRLSTPVKIALAGVAGLLIIAVGVFVGMHMGARRAVAAEDYGEAETLYEQGKLDYDREKLVGAAEMFESIRKQHAGTDAAAKASVMAHMARAHLAVLDGDWQAAAEQASQADDRLRAVQQGDRVSAAWVRATNDAVGGFETYRLNARAFAEAMEQARKELEAGRFDAAEATLRKQLEGVALTDRQRSRRDAFLRELRRQRVSTLFADAVEQGDTLSEQGDFAAADAAYDRAGGALDRPEAVEVLSTEELDSMQSRLSDKRSALEIDRRYAEALAAADAAPDKQEKIRYLEEAAKIKPSSELERRIGELRADIHYERAQGLRAAGDYEAAIAALETSLSHADRASVRRELEQLRAEMRQQEGISAGDAAAAAGDLQTALREYRKAAELGSTPELAEKINRTRYRIQLAEADRLRDAGRYDEAAAAYEQARQLRPQAGPEVDARLAALAQRRQYERLLAEGDERLEQRQWTRALDFYQQAEQVMSTEEVAQRQLQTKYLQNKAQGDEAMRRGNFREAIGYYKFAQGFRDTQEIRDLIAEAEAKAGGEEES